jgi:hypothetical protein
MDVVCCELWPCRFYPCTSHFVSDAVSKTNTASFVLHDCYWRKWGRCFLTNTQASAKIRWCRNAVLAISQITKPSGIWARRLPRLGTGSVGFLANWGSWHCSATLQRVTRRTNSGRKSREIGYGGKSGIDGSDPSSVGNPHQLRLVFWQRATERFVSLRLAIRKATR